MRRGASHAMAWRSSCTRRVTCGRCTFTTTSSPVRSVAACTCAIEAAAIGIALEAREDRLDGDTEVGFDDPAHVFERLRRHPVAQELELGDELLREEAFSRRDDLTHLDVGGPEAGERDPQPP